MEVNIGKGYASGMWKTAAAGTALPATLTTATVAAWGTEVGYVSEEGMTLHLTKDKLVIKDWAKVVRRIIITDHEETAEGKSISTTADVLETLFGAHAVTESEGTTTVKLSTGMLSEPAAFLFVMLDGEDVLGFGCEEGQAMLLDDVSLDPSKAIEWPYEITAMGEDGMVFIKTEGSES